MNPPPPDTLPGSSPRAVVAPVPRVASVDAYRGLVMLLMMAEVLRLCDVAGAIPNSSFWHILCWHQSHVEWIGCSLHDLIQPSFSFLVGVALPFSIANRRAQHQSTATMTTHALWRSLILILLGVVLRSTHSSMTNWTFEDTLTQIGLGYPFLFLLGFRPARDQWIGLALLVVGYWLAFVLYPLPASDFNYAKVGVPVDWPHLMNGFEAHWNKNSNLAWRVDTWFLNLFPRPKPFLYNGGGYATLSFIPTLATMILGLIAGEVIRSPRPAKARLGWLVVAGLVGLLTGAVAGWVGLCPVVKRIWTPSWVLFSGGWCFLFLAFFYGLMDLAGHKRWAFPLLVIGANSIAAYLIAHLFDAFLFRNLKTHFGADAFAILGKAYEPLLHGAAVLFIFWLILWWMYRRKLFLRI